METHIQHQYNDFHEVYTEKFTHNELSNTLFHEAFNFNVKGKKILDVGCGDGVDLAIFEQQGAKVFGIDPSSEFIAKAQTNNPTGIFKKGVGEALPCEDAKFDIVISKWAMQTSTDVPAVLREMARVIKKNGTLIYLTKHPFLQFLEKVRDNGHGVDYYQQQIVTSNIYSGSIVLKEPTHTMGEYLNGDFFSNFELLDYYEGAEFPASEQLNGDTYPTFFMVKARRK